MPHIRQRHLYAPFDKLSAHSRIVGILGHRQVGKTTFLEAHTLDYVTLDDANVLKQAKSDPAQFLSTLGGRFTCIDECQLAPELFPALKVRVQRNPKPGQFILSGSVRFTSRKAIRESLTGRIANLEMFPMVMTELEQEPLSDFFPKLLQITNLESCLQQRKTLTSVLTQRRKTVKRYLEQGGLPGVCFIREPATKNRILRDLLMTILDRDLRLVYSTTVPYSQIFELCQSIARRSLSGLQWSELRQETGLAEKTLRKLVQALEAVFLIRPIPIEGGGSRGIVYFFEDQLESSFFTQTKNDDLADWTGLAYRNIRAQFEYRLGFSPQYFHYLTRAGAMIPLAIRSGGEVIGIYPVSKRSEITRTQMAAASSFLRTYGHSKVVFLTFDEFESTVVDSRVITVPAEIALF